MGRHQLARMGRHQLARTGRYQLASAAKFLIEKSRPKVDERDCLCRRNTCKTCDTDSRQAMGRLGILRGHQREARPQLINNRYHS
jgi:hypothetical protein